MMIGVSTNKIEDVTTEVYRLKRSKKYDKPVSDTIYTFDIEVSSLFLIKNKWQRFDYSIPPDKYTEIKKAAVPYIWMFGIEDTTYYGRELWDFEDVLRKISDPDMYKIIWVHNLSYEMTFLMNIFYERYSITDVIARDVKKVIEFRVKELNIIFRCSYMLTNLSLSDAADEYTNVKKRVGDLDYNVERSPLTPLTKKELEYCEYDIITLREIIRHYLREYQHLINIPLTSTGTVRKALKGAVDIYYIRRMQSLVPDADIYLMLWAAFAGGYTHANMLHSGRLFQEMIESQDIASSYPAVLVTEMYPCSEFIRCRAKQFFNKKLRNAYCFLLRITIDNVDSRYYNHYLQFSKCVFIYKGNRYSSNSAVNHRKELGLVIDNGRVVKCENATIEICITDVDYDILTQNYSGKFKIVECYKSKKDYLDLKVIKFILNLYKNKTTLKGIKEKESIYRRDKARLNACFGMAVTNQLKNSCEFTNGVWSTKEFSREFIEEKLDDMKESFSTLFFYATGVWCTSYARRNLYQKIVLSSHKMDRDTLYNDTDSCKFRHREEHQELFLSYNNEMIEKYRDVCQRYPDLNLSDFMPADKEGVLHPIGFFEFDGAYTEFITLGAKKYCYRDAEKNKLHITVSGVSKSGVVALEDDIRNFKKPFTWDYYTSGKKTHYYREVHLVNGKIQDDRQPCIVFDDREHTQYISKYQWSIILMPTTYTLGVTDIYEALLKEVLEKEVCK